MKLTPADIAAFARAIPAGTIAAYSGIGDHGIIRVLARQGKIANGTEAYEMLGGNVVDGPALRWLGQQQSPRYWVCDGYVTGVNDKFTKACTSEAQKIQSTIGAIRIPSLSQAKTQLIRRR
jgi:hypothetical protein